MALIPFPRYAVEEEADLARAVARDPQAAKRVLLDVLPRVRNLVRFLVRGDRDADDLTQEALATIAAGLPTFRGDGPFAAWVDRTVVRSTFALLRRRKARDSLVVLSDTDTQIGEGVAPHGDEYVMRRWAVAVLDELPIDQRHAMILHHVLGMSVPEVSATLDISAETVRSRLRLARVRLRSRALQLGDAPSDGDGGEEEGA